MNYVGCVYSEGAASTTYDLLDTRTMLNQWVNLLPKEKSLKRVPAQRGIL